MKKQSAGCSTIFLIVLAVVVAIAVTVLAPMTQQQPAHGEPSWYTDLQKKIQHLIPGQQSGTTKSTPAAQHTTGKTQLTTTLSGSCFEMAHEAAVQAGINPNLYVRQINQESGCTNVTSPAGASGVAQLMPEMALGLGVDTNNMQQSLQAGAHLMAGYLKKYGGSWPLALACYNAGSGATASALKTYGEAWLSHLPAETQNYVRSILG